MQILADLMDRLGVGRASLVGNSMGGRIVWNFAALHPERVTRLVARFAGRASPARALPMTARQRRRSSCGRCPMLRREGLLKAGLAAAYARVEALSEATLTRYRDLLLAPGVRRAIVARMGQVILHDPAPTLARIKAPTLLLWGERDGIIPISNAAEYLRDLPHATLVRLPNLGHVPFEEDPAASLRPLQRFLSSETASSRRSAVAVRFLEYPNAAGSARQREIPVSRRNKPPGCPLRQADRTRDWNSAPRKVNINNICFRTGPSQEAMGPLE